MRYGLALLGVAMVVTSVALLLTNEPEIPRETSALQATEIVADSEPKVEARASRFLDRDLEVPPEHEPEPEPDAEPVARPVHLEVEAIGVDHPVVDVGLNPDGSMEIPDDVNDLGWYEPGVMPGELGSAVIAGHVDSRAQGHGAFFDLRLLEIGDVISITDEGGATRSWAVDRLTRYDKDDIPLEDIFRWDGDSGDLALITCGGEFDRTRRSYEDNIVVYATPID